MNCAPVGVLTRTVPSFSTSASNTRDLRSLLSERNQFSSDVLPSLVNIDSSALISTESVRGFHNPVRMNPLQIFLCVKHCRYEAHRATDMSNTLINFFVCDSS